MWKVTYRIVLFLDAYYLGLKKGYRNLEASFIKKLRAPEDCSSCVFDFNYTHADEFKKDENFKKGLMSTATCPLYSILAVIR